jgi:hypothetical protein
MYLPCINPAKLLASMARRHSERESVWHLMQHGSPDEVEATLEAQRESEDAEQRTSAAVDDPR